MYTIRYVKSKFDNLKELVDKNCTIEIKGKELYVTSKDKYIKIKSNKIKDITGNMKFVADNNTIIILEVL